MHEFGPFRYDPDQKVLFRDGAVVALAPKAVETLHAVLERRGRIVEKTEPMTLVRPDTRVEEIGEARNISLLRKRCRLSLPSWSGCTCFSPSTVRRYQQAWVPMSMMDRVIGLDVLVKGTVQNPMPLTLLRRITTGGGFAPPQPGTLEKPGDTSASQPGQTTKSDGLPYGDSGFSFVSVPAGWHINTLEKPGRYVCFAAGQTTKSDGLPNGDSGFSFVSVPAGWHINTLEKPGCCAAWQTTKNDGLPHGGGGFSFVSVPAGWHINTLEKPGRYVCFAAGQTTKSDGLPHERGGFSFVSVPAGWHINTLEKPGRYVCFAAGQTTKSDGLPHERGGFSFVSVPAGWHINTLEKPGRYVCFAAGQTTKDDGLPYGDSGFSFVSVQAGWHINTLEKPGSDRLKSVTVSQLLPGLFIAVRGPRAHAGRPQKRPNERRDFR